MTENSLSPHGGDENSPAIRSTSRGLTSTAGTEGGWGVAVPPSEASEGDTTHRHPHHVRSRREVPQDVTDEADVEYRQTYMEVGVLLDVFRELKCALTHDDKILDFGCGEGSMVYAFRQLGYEAFGTDLVEPSKEIERRMEDEGLRQSPEKTLTVIPRGGYRIPFDSDYFDVVISWNVMEHVKDHRTALSEISRVLKSGGRSLHYFPARHRIMEPHVGVPLASLFQNYSYLFFWAAMGLRDESQVGLTAKETALKNYEYLKAETNYLKEKQLLRLLRRHFVHIEHVEKHFWKYMGGKSGCIHKLLSEAGLEQLLPVAASGLSRFGYRAIHFRKP